MEKSCGTITLYENKVLMVKQNNDVFGFPKGHVEEGETEKETAIRETKEETNIDVIIEDNIKFKANYKIRGDIDKEVIYFIAKPQNSLEIKPQEGEISEVHWIDMDKVEDKLIFENTKNLWKEAQTYIEGK